MTPYYSDESVRPGLPVRRCRVTAPTIGSLCSGYGGLDLAAEQVTGGTTVWHCENEAAPSKLLALRFPGVPNHHDVKALVWAEHPIDVLTGGYPCQPFSGAGKRLGTDDTRHLFPWIAEGVARMRPPLLLLENVRGHLSLGFDVVLAELHRLDYDVRWTILPASAVGAPHGRARLWIAARSREVGGWSGLTSSPTAYADEQGGWFAPQSGLFGDVSARTPGTVGVMVDGMRWDGDTDTSRLVSLLPTPTSRDHKGANQRGDDTCLHGALLPTPRATDGTKAGPNQRGSSGDLMLPSAVQLLPTPTSQNASGNGRNGRGEQLLPGVVQLLPTPLSADGGGARGSSAGFGLRNESRIIADAWGPYAAAVARWEALTRPAPAPTEQGRSGPRLSPAFVEWLMGLPEGWVTGVPGLTRNHQLTMLGNGVVPQCAVAAYTLLGVTELFREAAA